MKRTWLELLSTQSEWEIERSSTEEDILSPHRLCDEWTREREWRNRVIEDCFARGNNININNINKKKKNKKMMNPKTLFVVGVLMMSLLLFDVSNTESPQGKKDYHSTTLWAVICYRKAASSWLNFQLSKVYLIPTIYLRMRSAILLQTKI